MCAWYQRTVQGRWNHLDVAVDPERRRVALEWARRCGSTPSWASWG